MFKRFLYLTAETQRTQRTILAVLLAIAMFQLFRILSGFFSKLFFSLRSLRLCGESLLAAAHGAVAVGLSVESCFIHFFEVEQDVIFPVGLFESFLVLPHAGAVFSRQLDGEIIDQASKGAETAEDGNML